MGPANWLHASAQYNEHNERFGFDLRFIFFSAWLMDFTTVQFPWLICVEKPGLIFCQLGLYVIRINHDAVSVCKSACSNVKPKEN